MHSSEPTSTHRRSPGLKPGPPAREEPEEAHPAEQTDRDGHGEAEVQEVTRISEALDRECDELPRRQPDDDGVDWRGHELAGRSRDRLGPGDAGESRECCVPQVMG